MRRVEFDFLLCLGLSIEGVLALESVIACMKCEGLVGWYIFMCLGRCTSFLEMLLKKILNG